ncbi:MAG: hypothetical protein ACTSR9_19385 [Candidatus Thorarchaeota archaeon]
MAGEGKVIKPPIENVASGKIIKPSKAFRNKMWFTGIFTATMLWVIIFGSFWFVLWLAGLITGTGPGTIFEFWWVTLNLWYFVLTAIWLIPALIIVPIYLRSIEYSVITEEGTTASEIFSRAGLFDRLFGIGSIEIETAGYSGSMQSAEEKLEGITFYEELRDFILRELRKFKDPYVTGTEIVHPVEEPVPRSDDTLEDEILLVLREIRDLLRRQKE